MAECLLVDLHQTIVDLELAPSEDSPARVRQWVSDLLDDCEPSDDVRYIVILVVDELVTNAIVHAGTPIRVTVGRKENFYRCIVHDECAEGPYPRIIDLAEGWGRGLRVVALFSEAWGVERDAGGTTVWAEIDADHAATRRRNSGSAERASS